MKRLRGEGIDPLMATLIGVRRRSGHSQAWLADEMGVSQSAVSMWESGAREPRVGNLRGYATVFGYELVLLRTAGAS